MDNSNTPITPTSPSKDRPKNLAALTTEYRDTARLAVITDTYGSAANSEA